MASMQIASNARGQSGLLKLPAEILDLILDALEDVTSQSPTNVHYKHLRRVHTILWAYATRRLFQSLVLKQHWDINYSLQGIEGLMCRPIGKFARSIRFPANPSWQPNKPLQLSPPCQNCRGEDGATSCWANIKSMEFRFGYDTKGISLYQLPGKRIMDILPRMHNLQQLAFARFEDPARKDMKNQIKLPRFLHLKTLKLENCWFQLFHLRDFVLGHAESLRDLQLTRCEAKAAFVPQWLPQMLLDLQLESFGLTTERICSEKSIGVRQSNPLYQVRMRNEAQKTYDRISDILGPGQSTNFKYDILDGLVITWTRA